nr:hypothetical protein [Tanacetum cinerariifolium]
MLLDSIDNGPLVYPTVEENRQTRPKKYSKLTEAQQLQDDLTLQSQGEFPQLESGLAVPTFQQGEDPNECINKAMAFLSDVASRQPFKIEESQFNKFKKDKLRVLLPLETEELLQPQEETMQLVKQRGRAYGEIAHSSKKAKKFCMVLGEVDKIPHNLVFQIEDLDAYDLDCDDISLAKAVLMANLLSCDPDFLSEKMMDNVSEQMQMIGGNGENQFRQYVGNLNGYNEVQNVKNQHQIGNGNLVAARAEGNAAGQNANQIRCYNCRGFGHYARNCTARPRRRDAAYLQTQL